jgi:hypothetical protein
VHGSELASYLAWRDRRPADALELTALQREFLGASEAEEAARASAERKRLDEIAVAQAERQKALDDAHTALNRKAEAQKARSRRRIIWWVSGAAAVLLVLGVSGFAYQQYDFARQQSLNLMKQKELADEAKKQGVTAQAQTPLAEAKTKEAEENFRQGQVLGGRHAYPDHLGRRHGTAVARRRQAAGHLKGHTGAVISAVFSTDGKRILTVSSDRMPRLWDGDGKPLATLSHQH